MRSSSSYKSVNLNAHHDDPDEPPRLITYTKHSQGFTWNDELFLPSYLLGRGGRRRRKRYGYDEDEDGMRMRMMTGGVGRRASSVLLRRFSLLMRRLRL